MRAAGLFAAVALFGGSRIVAEAIHCYNHLLEGTPSAYIATTPDEALKSSITTLCYQALEPWHEETLQYQAGNMTLRISPEEGYVLGACLAIFDAIIAECILKEKASGGEAELDGVVYQVYDSHTTDSDHLHARLAKKALNEDYYESNGEKIGQSLEVVNLSSELEARGKAKPKPKPKPVEPKPKPKPSVNLPKPKPSSKPSKPVKPKPKPTRAPTGKPSPKPSPSKKTSTTKPLPTQTCKHILQLARKSNEQERRLVEGPLPEHDNFVGSLVQRGIRGGWKRTQKRGSFCGGTDFNALQYPEHNHPAMVCSFE